MNFSGGGEAARLMRVAGTETGKSISVQLYKDLLTGIHYKVGPATLRANYSAGSDANPYGFQQMWVPGVTIALTKNVDFYADWVRWDVYNNAQAVGNGGHREIEDGFSFVINWRF